MSIPVYGFLEGDTLGLLVLAEEGETVLELARKLQDAASIRVENSGIRIPDLAGRHAALPIIIKCSALYTRRNI